jgi:hypothetical protein
MKYLSAVIALFTATLTAPIAFANYVPRQWQFALKLQF